MTMMPKTKLSEDSPPRAPERVHLARGSPPRPSHMVHAGSGLLALKQRYSPPLQRKHLPYIGQQNELDPRFPQQMPGCCLYARAQLPPGAQQDSQSEEARTVAIARRTARAREPSMYGRRRTKGRCRRTNADYRELRLKVRSFVTCTTVTGTCTYVPRGVVHVHVNSPSRGMRGRIRLVS